LAEIVFLCLLREDSACVAEVEEEVKMKANQVVVLIVTICALSCTGCREEQRYRPLTPKPDTRTIWDSTSAFGTCECIHPWGRTFVTTIKAAHLTWRPATAWAPEKLELSATIAQPVIIVDGEERQLKDYFFPAMRQRFEPKNPFVMHYAETGALSFPSPTGEEYPIYHERTATVSFRSNDTPEKVVFQESEQAQFNVDNARRYYKTLLLGPRGKDLRAYIENEIDYLNRFDADGQWQAEFEARF
jgi:hypothetical protein